ncbi:MAG: TonB-dependent receptor [Chitinophagaceae bacterium]|nr:TonB-dependent receptor [Chitinophagaceae bacterium]
MRKTKSYWMALLLASFFTIAASAQTTITGKVENSTTKESIAAVSVSVKGTSGGTYTDDKGNFRLNVARLPVTLLISSVGYELQEVTVTDAAQVVKIDFKPSNILGQEVVISATKTSQKILESPVSIERISTAAIRNSPAATYYDVIGNLKGVDIVSSSLTFKTPTTRGFSGSGNLRVNQIVDGMDNQAPGLNFSVGSFVGMSELDVDNVELLPGASSALYGPGGMNGTILINSKNPFKYQGLSVQVKEGVMNTGHRFRQASNYVNGAFRFAHKFSDKFAFKVGAEFIRAKDWLGYDKRNYARTGTNGVIVNGDRATDPNYDGVNVYGDETTADIRTAVLNSIGASAAPFLKNFIDTLNNGRPINVSRTGYNENQVVNENTVNLKLSAAFHYKITNNTEASISGYWGTGNTVYTGSDRYSLRNLKMGQYKLEINNKNWLLRAYTTQEDAGDSYNATVTTRLLNEVIKPSGGSTGWFSTYAQNYLGARLNGLTDFDAQTLARKQADAGRYEPGSARFTKAFDSLRAIPISNGGGLFVDRTNLYQVEGQYNLSEYTGEFADVLVGANYKSYVLNSEGTLFADSSGKISIGEWGAYLQATKKLLEDKLKLTASIRYDKNENFKGRFTPRFTALIKVAENNNVRLSYQTAYRFPSTQQQWIRLNVGGNVKLVGGNNFFDSYYGFSAKPTYNLEDVSAYQQAEFKPEAVSTFEAGYKGLLAQGKLLVDVYGYYGQYQDFITRRLIITPYNSNQQQLAADLAAGKPAGGLGDIYSIPVNTTSKVKTFGYGISLDYRLPKGFQVGANLSSDELKDVPEGFKTYFSTPKYRTNVSFGNTGFAYKKRLSFNVTYRWQDAFYYESDFTNGTVNAIHTLDAQVSYKIPSAKSVIKIGANNMLNEYYTNGIGNAVIGGLYYVSFGYNIF